MKTDGTIEITNNQGYFTFGPSSSAKNNPYVSALNVGYGSGGISFRSSGTSVTDAGDEISSIRQETAAQINRLTLTAETGGRGSAIRLHSYYLEVIADHESTTKHYTGFTGYHEGLHFVNGICVK
jgi:hypothetical protein